MKLLNKIIIHTPIWNSKSIGIAERKMNSSYVEIKIDYKLKDGSYMYPESFIIDSRLAKTYPVQYAKGTKLHIIPISDLEIKSGY